MESEVPKVLIDPATFTRSQAMISALMNVVMNTIMTLIILSKDATVPVWGMGGVAFDLVPTTFMCILMAAWVPGAVSARLVRAGALKSLGRPFFLMPGNSFVRAAILALLGSALLDTSCALLFRISHLELVGIWTLLGFKAVLGIVLGLTIAPLAVRQSLARA